MPLVLFHTLFCTKVLGTFITEGDAGRTICDKLLSTKESAHTCAERLSELAIALGFDGWLVILFLTQIYEKFVCFEDLVQQVAVAMKHQCEHDR